MVEQELNRRFRRQPCTLTPESGPVIAFVMLELELSGRGSPVLYLYVLVPLSVVVPLAILPFSKGAIIGLFWAKNWSDEQER